VAQANDAKAGLALVERQDPDVVLTDLRMPGMDGIELLQRVKEIRPEIMVIVMTAYGTVKTAVKAMKLGAEDYLNKPIDVEELEVILQRVLEKKRLLEEARSLRERLDRKYRFDNLVGESPEILGVFKTIRQVAPSSASVLLLGESGTGKELFAQAIHQNSPRRNKPFVKLACAALPETLLESELFGHEKGSFTGALYSRAGRFEMADGGTLFLDEIGDISPTVQVKLLRFLEEREFERVGGNKTFKVDVRIIAATHRDLRKKIEDGSFREDLFYRLNVVEIPIPSLRDRTGDIPLLADHFLRKYAEANGKPIEGISDEAMALLLRHGWPGNVRELENAIERAVVLADGPALEPAHFPTLRRAAGDPAGGASTRPAGIAIPGSTLAEIEREAILRTLEAVQGSTSKAAGMLQISARKIQYKLKEYHQQGILTHR
jgi:DNA-binding NtrC family response regulator